MGQIKERHVFGATPIDDYSGLKLHHVTTTKELYDAEFTNITSHSSKYLLKPPSINVLMDRKTLFNIHHDMFSEVWEWAGKKRKSNKSVGVDKTQIDILIHQLIHDFQYWESTNMDVIEVSARLHHGLVLIHPFENGNGRWARLIINIYLQQKIKQMIQWPEKSLYINTTFRKNYIHALRQADEGDYTVLMDMHRECLRS